MSFGKRTAAHILAGAVVLGGSVLLSGNLTENGILLGQDVQAAEADGGEEASASKENETSRLLLPSCGVQYALSATKVSMRDVEDDLYDRGVITQKKTTAAEDAGTVKEEESLTPAACGAAMLYTSSAVSGDAGVEDTTAQGTEAVTEVSAILDTSLTPVQQTEQHLVREDAGTTAELDEARAVVKAAEAPDVTLSADTEAVSAQSPDTGAPGGDEKVPAVSAGAEGTAAAEEAVDASFTEGGGEEPSTAESKEAASEDAAAESTEDENADPGLAVSTASSYVNIRKDPSEDGEIIGKLYANNVGTVIEEADDNGWVKITSGSVTGYVKADYVATGDSAKDLADAVGSKKAVVTTQTLRVRAAASTESDVITLIGEGQTLDILEEEDGWYKVNTEDGEGYISADFTDVEVEYPEAVSIEEEQAALEAERAAEEAKAAAAKEESDRQAQEAEKAAEQAAASMGQSVVNYAMQFLGNPYVWGGSSLTNGTDCSGFTMSVYAHFGVSLPHYDAAQRSCGTAVSSLAAARPGDIVCYYGHVGIYIGNGQIINASNPRNGICITNATYRQIVAIRRIFT